jgi:hypothetical protein
MKVKGTITRTDDHKTVDVICDRCKKSCRVEEFKGRSGFYFATLKATGGYSSPILDDGLKTRAHLCEKCWLVARKALEAVGVKFIDTNYLEGNQPWAENDKRTEEINAAFARQEKRDIQEAKKRNRANLKAAKPLLEAIRAFKQALITKNASLIGLQMFLPGQKEPTSITINKEKKRV